MVQRGREIERERGLAIVLDWHDQATDMVADGAASASHMANC